MSFSLNSFSQSREKHISKGDVLEVIYSIADKMNMDVMSDMNVKGGDLYGKGTADEYSKDCIKYIDEYYKKYGRHPSFWGWYLNSEINPIDSTDYEQSKFWRTFWKSIVTECHRICAGTKVTISPFFLLDKQGLRGFKYREPYEYEDWWYHTMLETGIDILMLQDSGAEHLSFFTLNDRRPFFQAFANACRKAGKEFWVNVETGQVETKNWDEAIRMERNKNKAWAFTKMSWLKQKLDLAAEYGSGIINWGYYPLMNPLKDVLSLQDIDGQAVDLSKRISNYNSYKAYEESISDKVPAGKLTQPKMKGTLWFLPGNLENMNRAELVKAFRRQILYQKRLGFKLIWICNTSSYFTFE